MRLFRDPEDSSKLLKYKSIYELKVVNMVNNKFIESSQTSSLETKFSSLTDCYNESSLEVSLIGSNLQFQLDEYKPINCSSSTIKPKCAGINFVTRAFKPNFSKRRRPIKSKLNVCHAHKSRKPIYNNGRWTEDEHRRFLQAVFLFGNEWKNVEKHISSRSSAQSRSHSQKFFLKLAKYDIPELKGKKLCIETLYEVAKLMTKEERKKLLNKLISYEYSNEISDQFQQRSNYLCRKRRKESNKSIFDGASKDNEDDSIIPINLSVSSKTTANTSPTKLEKDFSDADDFCNHFIQIFQAAQNRRCSFDDNKNIYYYTVKLDSASSNKSTDDETLELEIVQYFQINSNQII